MIEVCDVSDVEAEHGFKADVDGVGLLAVFQFEGAYYVVDDKCTHGLGSLSDGKLKDDQVICAFHRGAFNFRTGEPTKAPCTIPLRTYDVQMMGTKIYIADPAPLD